MPQHNSSDINTDSGIERESVLVINDLKENVMKSTNQIKDLQERISNKNKTIADLENRFKTETDSLKEEVQTKAKIILNLNSKLNKRVARAD